MAAPKSGGPNGLDGREGRRDPAGQGCGSGLAGQGGRISGGGYGPAPGPLLNQ